MSLRERMKVFRQGAVVAVSFAASVIVVPAFYIATKQILERVVVVAI